MWKHEMVSKPTFNAPLLFTTKNQPSTRIVTRTSLYITRQPLFHNVCVYVCTCVCKSERQIPEAFSANLATNLFRCYSIISRCKSTFGEGRTRPISHFNHSANKGEFPTLQLIGHTTFRKQSTIIFSNAIFPIPFYRFAVATIKNEKLNSWKNCALKNVKNTDHNFI